MATKPKTKASERMAELAAAADTPPAAAGPRDVFRMLPIGSVRQWPSLNPLTHFDEEELDQLAESIRQHGVLLPLKVHMRDGDEWSEGLIVAGERRYRAAVRAGLAEIPCLVHEYTEEEAREVAIIENLQRTDLRPIEEALGFRTWLDAAPGRTQAALAQRVGLKPSTVANKLRLLALPSAIRPLVDDGIIPIRTARDVLLDFAQLAEAPREAFFDALTKRLSTAAKAGPVAEEEVRRVIRDIGLKLSRPLYRHHRNWQHDHEAPEFDAKKHDGDQGCGCGAPHFAWNEHSADRYVRCFDPAWWRAAQEEAAAAAARAARQRKADLTAAGAGKILPLSKLQDVHGWNGVAVVTGAEGPHQKLLHPDELETGKLTLAQAEYPKQEVVLACTNSQVIQRAETRADDEIAALLAQRQAERAEADRAAAQKKPFRLQDVAGLLLGNKPETYRLRGGALATAADLRLGKPAKASEEELQVFFSVFALRARRGDFNTYIDPLEAEVKKEVRERFTPRLLALREEFLTARPLPLDGAGKKKAKAAPATPPAPAPDPNRVEIDKGFAALQLRVEQLEANIAEEIAEGIPVAATRLREGLSWLRDFLVEIGASCIADGTPARGPYYSAVDALLLTRAEELLAQVDTPPAPPPAPVDIQDVLVATPIEGEPTVSPTVETVFADALLKEERKYSTHDAKIFRDGAEDELAGYNPRVIKSPMDREIYQMARTWARDQLATLGVLRPVLADA